MRVHRLCRWRPPLPRFEEVCCNDVCCAPGQLCRVIDTDKPGVCLDAPGFCDPACNADEVCVDSVCLCDTYPSPQACAAGQCCQSKTCDNPCSPNPCSGGTPLCSVDCTQPGGFKCASGCGGVDCSTRANTACDPLNGSCTCDLPPTPGAPGYNPEVCSAGTCCVANPGDAGHDFCNNPCSPNPCTSGSNTKCNIDCSNPNGFTCTNPCDGVVCTLPNTVCDSATGLCECGGTFCAPGGNNCCVGGTTCEDPCAGNPCGGQQCIRDCTQASGFSCKNNCVGVNCTGNVNPNCNPLNGQCECENTGNGSYAQCGASQCCNSGACANPCNPNPCTGGMKCNVDCNQPGGFTCTDPCAGNNCNTSTKGSDPDCRDVSGAAQCFCAGTGGTCTQGTQCCVEGSPGSCISPCTPNQCPADAGVSPSNPATFTKCVVDCLGGGANDYHCADPCAGVNCNVNPFNNPTCRTSPTNPQNSQCYCPAAGAQCSATTCCFADGCDDPCAKNPCGSGQTCTQKCNATDGTGRACSDNCPAGHCTDVHAPTCNPANGSCGCGVGGPTCASNLCCNGTSCVDPCAGNPCGATGVCVAACTLTGVGHTCNNQCNGVTCSNQNPDCDPTKTNPAQRCTCDLTAICTGNQCCIGDSTCTDVCGSGDPCTTAPNTKCTTDCNVPLGADCSDPCSGNTCNHAGTNNPQCRSTGAKGDSSECYCSASNSICSSGQCCLGGGGCTDPCAANPCGPSQGKCVADCSQVNGYSCQPQACDSSCVAPAQCDLRTATCDCGTLGTYFPMPPACEAAPVHASADGKNVCCFASASDHNLNDSTCRAAQCNTAADCTSNGPGSCTCDPCTGCVGTGENTCSHN